MTYARLNEALAVWAGWTRGSHFGRTIWLKPSPLGGDEFRFDAPNYCNDMNAVATLEAKAPDEYWSRLWTDTGAEIMSSMVDQSKALAGASPRLRSETLAKTAGVWREGE